MSGHPVAYRQWADPAEFRKGRLAGAVVTDAGVTVGEPIGVRTFADPSADRPAAEYDVATWSSPEVSVDFGAIEVVPSWNAATPPGTWLEIAVEVSSGASRTTYPMGRWAETTDDIQRTSVRAPPDDLATVDFDVLRAADGRSFDTWRLHATLLRLRGGEASPVLTLAAGFASGPGAGAPRSQPSARSTAWGVDLAVPAYSQVVHRGEYPELGGGGEAWCSPVSTAMVMAFHGVGPSPQDYAWVRSDCRQPWIDHAAAAVYDPALEGAGNWSFNVAYAGTFGLSAFVTRLRGLDDAEAFLDAGLPLVASVTFTADRLAGAGYGTAGHLLVIRGFTDAGDVIVNDPASHQMPSNDEVRAVYRRAEFEDAWLAGSAGLVYVLRHRIHALPARPVDGPARW